MRFLRGGMVLAAAALLGIAGYWFLFRPIPVSTVAPVRGAAAEIVYATPYIEVARIESLPFGEHSYVFRRPDRPDCLVVDPGF